MSGATWSSRWLDLVESAPVFDQQALRRGSDYAAFDWELDVEIEPGRAATTASSGKRMHYHATIVVPTLSSGQIDAIVESIAERTEQVAAVLDGELPIDIDDLLSFDPSAIVASCDCRSVDRPCRFRGEVRQ